MSTDTTRHRRFFTAGYEGLEVAELLELLRSNGVQLLVDVRERALSRKHGFSKSALRAAVEAAGMSYVHLPALGTPKAMRERFRADRDYDLLFKRYAEYLKTQDAALDELAVLMGERVCCLMCFERDVEQCHRSRLSEALAGRAKRRLAAVHL